VKKISPQLLSRLTDWKDEEAENSRGVRPLFVSRTLFRQKNSRAPGYTRQSEAKSVEEGAPLGLSRVGREENPRAGKTPGEERLRVECNGWPASTALRREQSSEVQARFDQRPNKACPRAREQQALREAQLFEGRKTLKGKTPRTLGPEKRFQRV
jgi:hypothetical protein